MTISHASHATAFAIATAVAGVTQAATYTTANLANGDWTASGTWVYASGSPVGTYPDAAGDIGQSTQNNSTNGGNIVTRNIALDADITLGILETTSTGTLNIDQAAGETNTLTFDNGASTSVLGRTTNNSGAGLLSVDPNILLKSDLRISNSRGGNTSATGVEINGSITNASGTAAANVVIRQGNNGGQSQGTSNIVLNGLLNNTGTVNISDLSSAVTTGNIVLAGGVGSNVTTFTTDATNEAAVILGGNYAFDLGLAPDQITHNSGILDIDGLTLALSGPATLPSYVLIDYSAGDGTLATAVNAATDDTFFAVTGLPTGYEITNDVTSERVLLSVVPEPAALSLLSAAIPALMRRRSR